MAIPRRETKAAKTETTVRTFDAAGNLLSHTVTTVEEKPVDRPGLPFGFDVTDEASNGEAPR